MNLYEKWLSRVPGELRLLGLAILAVAPASPKTAVGSAFSWVIGLLFFRFYRSDALKGIPFNIHFNLAAVGVALSFGREWSLTLGVTIATAAFATVLLTTMINRLFYYYWIPVLALPAVAVTWASHNVLGQGSAVQAWNEAADLKYTVAVFAVLSVISSPIFFGMFGFGLAVGLLWQWALGLGFLGSVHALFAQGVCFALCACILSMPSKRSMTWAVFAVSILSVYLTIHSSLNEPTYFSLFVGVHIACVLTIYGSRIYSRYSYVSWRTKPEHKLEDKLTHWQRFRAGEARVALPYKGTWKVSQGFDGEWTHRGIWQQGIDFIMVDEAGKSFCNNGYELSDYYAFGKDVLSPVSGYVVAMFQDLPDHPVGSFSNQNNFGNYVIIRDAFGAHALLGHLKQGSLTCSLYQYVESGQVIGQCGNSGYSPEPHIHMHVQADAVVGSATIPFHLTNYLIGDQFYFHDVPETNNLVTRLEMNQSLSRSLGFRINERFSIVSKDANQTKLTSIENQLDPYWGSMYFTDGSAKLFHYRDGLTFYFHRYEGRHEGPLFDLMTALPRVPLIYGIKCKFEDLAPIVQWSSKWDRWRDFFQLIFVEKSMGVKMSFHMNCDTLEIKSLSRSGRNGIATSCVLDPVEGFVEFTVGDRKYEVRSAREHGSSSGLEPGSYGSSENIRRIV